MHHPGVHDLDDAHSRAMVPVPVAATTPTAAVLPRTGWTATASDEETTGEPGAASQVLDGSATTWWHSKWSAPATPLPHSIVIDMTVPVAVAGLHYLPRPDGGTGAANGRIGGYSLSVSLDGTNWGAEVATGTWADDAVEKAATFVAVEARYVRLTALTEAGGRGPWTSAAEINLIGAPTRLDRTGWTATADSVETTGENGVATNVLDADPASIWHTQWTAAAAPLPHTLTVDTKAPHTISGLAYLPRQTVSPNGRIGRFEVAVSTDGVVWGAPVVTGTWADSPTEKAVAFTDVTARFVRLTALTEAGNRGPWSSAAEVNLLGAGAAVPPQPAGAGGKGVWGPVIGLPIVPVSAVVLPGNKLLTFSAYSPVAFGGGDPARTQIAVLDLNTDQVSNREIANTGHEMFCTGLAMLPDGRLLIEGGSSAGRTTIYDPRDNTWVAGPPLNIPRGYQGDATLSDGRVFTLGGSWSGARGGKNAEIFTPDGSYALLPGVTSDKILTGDGDGVYRADNHGWFFAVAGGSVFHAGPSKQLNWITTTGAGSITGVGTRGDDADAMNGNAAMYDIGKILVNGGAPNYQYSDATANAFTIDINRGPGQPVTVTRVGNMTSRRAFQNSVVLPDGKVFVVGGQSYPVPFTDDGAAMVPDLWDPATGTFTTMAPMAVPRTYHSVAVLLPDGRVFSAGGGLCGQGCATNHPDGQMFTPPYLLNSDGSPRVRPVITTAPATGAPGTSMPVTTDAAVESFAMVRMTATTHSVNNDQRRIPLTIASRNGTTYGLAVPGDTGVVVPGNYLVFAFDAAGTPSVGRTVNIR